jgi:hypothetical protein
MNRRTLDALDQWVARHEGFRPIGEGGYIFRFRTTRHWGRRLTLADGTQVEPGDRIGELHIDNQRAAALHWNGHAAIRFRHELFRAFLALAADLANRPEYRTIQAVGGASLFWEGAAQWGFEHRPLPPFTRWWLGWWERFLLAQYHPDGPRRIIGRRMELRKVWITRRALRRLAERAAAKRAAGGPGVAAGFGAAGAVGRSGDTGKQDLQADDLEAAPPQSGDYPR